MDLSRAVDVYVSAVCAGKNNETPVAYRRKLKCLLDFVGDRDVNTLTLADLQSRATKTRGKAVVPGPLSPWYIRNVAITAKNFCRWLHAHAYVQTNFAAPFKIPKEPDPTPKAVDSAIVMRLLSAAARMGEEWERARNVCLICCLFDTGGRLGGLVGAQIGGLNLSHGLLTVVEKGHRERFLLLNEASIFALGQWLSYRSQMRPKTEHLFISQRGVGLTRNGVYSIFDRLGAAAGVQGYRFNPHAFRHALAIEMLLAGARIHEVSQIMGHKSILTTAKYYGKYELKHLQEAHQTYGPGARMLEKSILRVNELE